MKKLLTILSLIPIIGYAAMSVMTFREDLSAASADLFVALSFYALYKFSVNPPEDDDDSNKKEGDDR